MNILVLTDDTKLTVINPSENSFQMETTAAEMVETFSKLTEENCAKIELQNETGDVMATFVNKKPASCTYSVDGIATFNLANVDMTAKEMTDLKAQVADANNAIAEMSELMASMM